MDARAWNARRVTWAAAVAVASLSAWTFGQTPAPAAREYTTWRDYAGSADSMQYSALDQIRASNVATLEPAWFYPVPGDPERLVFNPLIVDDVMYVAGPAGRLVAL